MTHIFISYSKHNRNYARSLADELLRQGFDVWIDDNIEYSDDWWARIVEAIKVGGAFILIMSPSSDDSKWVRREVSFADELSKQIFPLLLQGKLVEMTHWVKFLNTQYSDVSDGKLPSESFYTKLSQYAPRGAVPGREFSTKNRINAQDIFSILPYPFEWCKIPKGIVKSGNQLHNVGVFHMAKYPITNAQFQGFVDASDGYRNITWWSDSLTPYKWHRNNPTPIKATFPGSNKPREMVSWFEAIAFCHWLSEKTGLVISLPTTLQRQRAVHCDDGRQYPWGDEFHPGKCNLRENLIRGTTSVIKYSSGANAYGVMI